MHIVLITTPVRINLPNYIVPVGILSIAAYLEQFGHKITVIDNAKDRKTDEEIVGKLKELKPDLIGIGGIITAYAYIVSLSNRIKKELPDIKIVLGGQVTVNNAHNCFKHMGIDYLVYGYGEIALKKIIDHLQGNLPVEEIPGIAYKNNDLIIEIPGREYFKHVDELPLPAYHLVDMEHYAR